MVISHANALGNLREKNEDESVKKCILSEHCGAMRVYAFQDSSEDF